MLQTVTCGSKPCDMLPTNAHPDVDLILHEVGGFDMTVLFETFDIRVHPVLHSVDYTLTSFCVLTSFGFRHQYITRIQNVSAQH